MNAQTAMKRLSAIVERIEEKQWHFRGETVLRRIVWVFLRDLRTYLEAQAAAEEMPADPQVEAWRGLGEWFDANAPDEGDLAVVTHDPEDGFTMRVIPAGERERTEEDQAVGAAVSYLDARDADGWVWQRFGSHPHYVARKRNEDSISGATPLDLAAKVRARLREPEPPAPPPTVPPEATEVLRQAGVVLEHHPDHVNPWWIRQEGSEVTAWKADDDWNSIVRSAKAHDSRLSLVDWCKAGGGEEAAVLAECGRRGWGYASLPYNREGKRYGVRIPILGGAVSCFWEPRASAALLAALQATQQIAPWSEWREEQAAQTAEETAEEWQVPDDNAACIEEIVNGLNHMGMGVLADALKTFAVVRDGFERAIVEDLCRWVHARAHPRFDEQLAEGDGVLKVGVPAPADGVMREVALGEQEHLAPEPMSVAQQLETLGARLQFMLGSVEGRTASWQDVIAENGKRIKRRGGDGATDEECLAFARANRPAPIHCPPAIGEDLDAALERMTAPVPAALTVSPEVAKALWQAGARVRWDVQDGKMYPWLMTTADPTAPELRYAQDETDKMLRDAKAHDNRPSLKTWAAEHGGEAAAVATFCTERGWGFSHDPEYVTVETRFAVKPIPHHPMMNWKRGLSWSIALSAACEATKVPTPWGPDKVASPEAEAVCATAEKEQAPDYAAMFARRTFGPETEKVLEWIVREDRMDGMKELRAALAADAEDASRELPEVGKHNPLMLSPTARHGVT